jgi:uridine kinase
MTNDHGVQQIAEVVLRRKTARLLTVAVDGIDVAGKTTLADSLGNELQRREFHVIRASIDGFHNPAEVRYARGKLSPEGYFYDSFNYDALIKFLLLPLRGAPDREYRSKVFDFATDLPVRSAPIAAPNDGILIFDGVFLFRPELLDYWDIKIFIDIPFEESLRRALRRDRYLFGGSQAIEERYTRRYIPGQKLYLELCHPKTMADIVIQNEDPSDPTLEIIGG